jgi:hypothetical protein
MLIHGNSRFELRSLTVEKAPDSTTESASAGPSSSEEFSALLPDGKHFRLPPPDSPGVHRGHHGHRGHNRPHELQGPAASGPPSLLSKLEETLDSALIPAHPPTNAIKSDTTSETTTAPADLETDPTTVANATSPAVASTQTGGSAKIASASVATVPEASVASFTMISSLSSLANSLKNL